MLVSHNERRVDIRDPEPEDGGFDYNMIESFHNSTRKYASICGVTTTQPPGLSNRLFPYIDNASWSPSFSYPMATYNTKTSEQRLEG
jgi:hypothetical protein